MNELTIYEPFSNTIFLKEKNEERYGGGHLGRSPLEADTLRQHQEPPPAACDRDTFHRNWSLERPHTARSYPHRRCRSSPDQQNPEFSLSNTRRENLFAAAFARISPPPKKKKTRRYIILSLCFSAEGHFQQSSSKLSLEEFAGHQSSKNFAFLGSLSNVRNSATNQSCKRKRESPTFIKGERKPPLFQKLGTSPAL